MKLITQALDAVAADLAIGRAEALRRSMLALIEKARPPSRVEHHRMFLPLQPSDMLDRNDP